MDAFETAARTEAVRWWQTPASSPGNVIEKLGQHMAEWARTYLAEQEPSDAECVAVLDVRYGGPLEPYEPPYDDEEMAGARAALSAARAEGRDAR